MIHLKNDLCVLNNNRHRRIVMYSKANRHQDNTAAIERTVYDQIHFKIVLEQERRKSTPLKRQFSLLLFKVSTEFDYDFSIETICNNVRRTDIVGIFDETHVGVILPETMVSGAWIVESRLKKLMESSSISVAIHIKTHMYSEISSELSYPSLDTHLIAR